MYYELFSIHDSKGRVYAPPKAHKTIEEAQRFFQHVINTKAEGNFLHDYPEDFDLFHTGTFDDQTGKVQPFEAPRHIVKAIALKNQNA